MISLQMPDGWFYSCTLAKQLMFFLALIGCVFGFWRIRNQYLCPVYLFLTTIAPVSG